MFDDDPAATVELGEDERTVWLILAEDSRVLVPLSELATKAGLDPTPMAESLGRLLAAGLVDPSTWG